MGGGKAWAAFQIAAYSADARLGLLEGEPGRERDGRVAAYRLPRGEESVAEFRLAVWAEVLDAVIRRLARSSNLAWLILGWVR